MQNNNLITTDYPERIIKIKDIYSLLMADEGLRENLLFKGWTSLMLFYWLDRFSEDLDFNLIDDRQGKETIEKIYKILNKNGYMMEEIHDRDNLFCIDALYTIWENTYSCKIEIFKNNFLSNQKFTYSEWACANGIYNVKLLSLDENFLHKSCAYLERWSKAIKNSWRPKWRDLFDIGFYLDRWTEFSIDALNARKWYSSVKRLVAEIVYTYVIWHWKKKIRDWFLLEFNSFSNTWNHTHNDLNNIIDRLKEKYLGNFRINLDLMLNLADDNYVFQLIDDVAMIMEGDYYTIKDKWIELFRTNKKEKLIVFIKEFMEERIFAKIND